MGKITSPHKVKLICGFIFKSDTAYRKAKAALTKRFGAIDYESAVLPFTLTDYYEAEFGPDLQRAFVAFKKLIPADSLNKIKVAANRLESKLAHAGRRTVNIDPGYVNLAKLVLASTKDFAHRIYLGKGIFAETTLMYRGKSFTTLEWTYPDYRSGEYIGIFNRIREHYAASIKVQ